MEHYAITCYHRTQTSTFCIRYSFLQTRCPPHLFGNSCPLCMFHVALLSFSLLLPPSHFPSYLCFVCYVLPFAVPFSLNLSFILILPFVLSFLLLFAQQGQLVYRGMADILPFKLRPHFLGSWETRDTLTLMRVPPQVLREW